MRFYLAAGAFSMLAAVALGAFGAHGLKDLLPQDRLAIFHTGVQYQMVHALGLLVIGILDGKLAQARGLTAWAGGLLLAGTILFSGSLYLLAITGARWLGVVTPLGGLCFLAGWGALAAAAWRRDGH